MATSAGKSPGIVTLKPVSVSKDGAYLMLARRANAKTGSFRVAVDKTLVRRVEQARKRVAAAAARPPARKTKASKAAAESAPAPPPRVSKLSIKEIQGLLRQGRSVASIAKRAGMDEAWVERFEGPIVWERAGMVQRAQRAHLTRPRKGAAALPLGEAVAANLKRRGAELSGDNEGWDSIRRGGRGVWIVTVTFSTRGRNYHARWEFDPDANKLSPLSATASQLGWVDKRPRRAS